MRVSVTQMFDVRASLLKCAPPPLRDKKFARSSSSTYISFILILGRFELMPVSNTKFFHVRDSTQMRTSNFA